jgi:hypothetical protein
MSTRVLNADRALIVKLLIGMLISATGIGLMVSLIYHDLLGFLRALFS